MAGWIPLRGGWSFFISPTSQQGAPSTMQKHASYRGCWDCLSLESKGRKEAKLKPDPSNQGLCRGECPLFLPGSSKETIREPARGNWPHRSVDNPLVVAREAGTTNSERTCLLSSPTQTPGEEAALKSHLQPDLW